MKEIELLGIKVKECSLRESLKISDGYLRNGALNTVIYISSKLLVDAGNNEIQKQWIESADLTVLGDASVLKNSGDAPQHRIDEIEKDVYFREYLKKLVRMHRTVYLLTDTPEHLDTLRKEIDDYQPNLGVIGEYVMSEQGEDTERLFNKLNDIAPSVIISRIDYALQAGMMQEGKTFLNADVWLGLLDSPAGKSTHVSKLHEMIRNFYRILLFYHVRKDRKDQNEK